MRGGNWAGAVSLRKRLWKHKAAVGAAERHLGCVDVAFSKFQSLLFYWTATFCSNALPICNKGSRYVWWRKHIFKTFCFVFRIFGYCLISSLVKTLVHIWRKYWLIHLFHHSSNICEHSMGRFYEVCGDRMVSGMYFLFPETSQPW